MGLQASRKQKCNIFSLNDNTLMNYILLILFFEYFESFVVRRQMYT